MFNINFDGASRGNSDDVRYGGLCRDLQGRVIFVFLGSIGRDTNNSVELEGMIQALNCVVRSNSFPAIIENDSNIMIQIARWLEYGQVSGQVSTRWRLASLLDDLCGMLHTHSVVSFCHVRRDANKVVDLLANVGFEGEMAHQWGPLENFEADD